MSRRNRPPARHTASTDGSGFCARAHTCKQKNSRTRLYARVNTEANPWWLEKRPAVPCRTRGTCRCRLLRSSQVSAADADNSLLVGPPPSLNCRTTLTGLIIGLLGVVFLLVSEISTVILVKDLDMWVGPSSHPRFAPLSRPSRKLLLHSPGERGAYRGKFFQVALLGRAYTD